jgi:glyoxylase-like metal-dependent hydrolase (beta-lactamase superfamily II)
VKRVEYIDINDRIAIIADYNNVGVIKNGAETILVDSGLEDKVIKKICKILEEKGLIPAVVINTHSHADHCGGNHYLQEKYNVEIYTSAYERCFVENPALEPICFSGGARPLVELENKFLQAKPSRVSGVVKVGESITIKGVEISFVALPGHTFEQIGVEVEGTLFCGDSFFSEHVLEKYKLPYLVDYDQTLETLKFLRDSDYKLYLPSHGVPTVEIETAAELNISKIRSIEEDILAILKEEKTSEELLADIFQQYKIEIASAQQYCLLKTTVLAYLSSLKNRSIIETGFKRNILSWGI